jgi:TusE/DsrC/DsvC family sulfur relay protein
MLVDLTAIAFNTEGFMTNPNEWTKEIADVLAKQEGIESLTAEHWKIIDFCRQTGLASGKAPTIRQITTGTGSSPRDLPKRSPRSLVSANPKVVCNSTINPKGLRDL